MRSFWGCISICAAHLSWRVLPPRLSQVKYGANCVCVNGSGQVYSWIQREYPPSWRVQLSVVFRRVSLPTGVVHANAPLVGESSGCDDCSGTIKAAWMRGRFGFDIFRVELESVDSQHTHTPRSPFSTWEVVTFFGAWSPAKRLPVRRVRASIWRNVSEHGEAMSPQTGSYKCIISKQSKRVSGWRLQWRQKTEGRGAAVSDWETPLWHISHNC